MHHRHTPPIPQPSAHAWLMPKEDATADAAAVLGVPEDDGFHKVGDVEM